MGHKNPLSIDETNIIDRALNTGFELFCSQKGQTSIEFLFVFCANEDIHL